MMTVRTALLASVSYPVLLAEQALVLPDERMPEVGHTLADHVLRRHFVERRRWLAVHEAICAAGRARLN